MKTSGRRFHFQLTPLLDLLLIVIFAQYLEVTQQVERESAATQRQIAAREAELDRDYARLKRDIEEERAALAAERMRLADREAAIAASAQESQQRVEDVVAQQRRAARLMAEIFSVPPELVEDAFSSRPTDATSRTPQEIERLRQRFQELASLRGTDVIEHLLSYEELRKRADVWTLRIEENGEISFSSGEAEHAFRATTPAEFSSRLFARYKTLPQPKGLVILLVSYGDARADVRQAVLTGLPEAIRLMREDRLGRTQFEYAILGYVPDDAAE